MSTKAIIVGYAGIESYDLILYTAKLLTSLGKKVLLIDNSTMEALTYCIPIPEALNPKFSKVNFSGGEFLKARSAREFSRDYDYILMDFGFNTGSQDIKSCSCLFLITDKQQHNISQLKKLNYAQEASYLIIKEVMDADNGTWIYENLRAYKENLKDYFYLYYDDVDKECMISLQYHYEIKLKRLSGQFKYVLFQIFSRVFEYDETDIMGAYKKVKRGGKLENCILES